MFENIEQLEKEVAEFEANIAASSELLSRLKNISDQLSSYQNNLSLQVNEVKQLSENIALNNKEVIIQAEDAFQKSTATVSDTVNSRLGITEESLKSVAIEHYSKLSERVNSGNEATLDQLDKRSAELGKVITQQGVDLQTGISSNLNQVGEAVKLSTHEEISRLDSCIGDLNTNLNSAVNQHTAELSQKIVDEMDELKTIMAQQSLDMTMNLSSQIHDAGDELKTSLNADLSKLETLVSDLDKKVLEAHARVLDVEKSINSKFIITIAGILVSIVVSAVSLII